jgi:hypothetical protein
VPWSTEPEWYGNEDAGDLSMMGAADYSGHLGEQMWDDHNAGLHESSPDSDCPDCE